MKPKHKPCINCGANKYEIKSLNTLKCEYCGTEYEIEMPESVISHTIQPFNFCEPPCRVDYDYKRGETRYYNEFGELMRIDH